MVILKKKIQNDKWKLNILIDKFVKLEKYTYIPRDNIEKYISDQIIKYAYDNNVAYNNEAIYIYIQKLEKLLNKPDILESDKKKILSLIDKLNILETYYVIQNKFYPQITVSIDTNIYRFFYYPLFNWKFKHITNIFKFGFIQDHDIYEFDINGALLRAFYFYLYKKYKNEKFKLLYSYNDDIYDITSKLLNLNNTISRDKRKKLILSLITGKDKIIEEFKKHLTNESNFFKFFYQEILNSNTELITKLLHILILSEFNKNKILIIAIL